MSVTNYILVAVRHACNYAHILLVHLDDFVLKLWIGIISGGSSKYFVSNPRDTTDNPAAYFTKYG